eukprot:scaffold23845_cov112-Isochrysis_galbana.AAC.2
MEEPDDKICETNVAPHSHPHDSRLDDVYSSLLICGSLGLAARGCTELHTAARVKQSAAEERQPPPTHRPARPTEVGIACGVELTR